LLHTSPILTRLLPSFPCSGSYLITRCSPAVPLAPDCTRFALFTSYTFLTNTPFPGHRWHQLHQ
jgi:hypothetical protein